MCLFPISRITLLVAGLAITSGAAAEGLYGGIGGGRSESDPEQLSDPVVDELIEEFEAFGGDVSREYAGDSLKAFLGYRLTRNFAIEGGMLDMGDVHKIEMNIVEGSDSASGLHRVEVDGTYFALVVHAPISERSSVNVRAGTYKWDAKILGQAHATSGGETEELFRFSDSVDGDDSFYGIGLDLGGFGIQYEKYKLEDADIDYLGIVLKFGSSPDSED
jgi:hypothetical protein